MMFFLFSCGVNYMINRKCKIDTLVVFTACNEVARTKKNRCEIQE